LLCAPIREEEGKSALNKALNRKRKRKIYCGVLIEKKNQASSRGEENNGKLVAAQIPKRKLRSKRGKGGISPL